MSEADTDRNDNQQKTKGILRRSKQWLFQRNFELTLATRLTIIQAVVLIIIEQFQLLAIISRLQVNPTIKNSPEMAIIDSMSKCVLLKIPAIAIQNYLFLSIGLLIFQILLLACQLLPLRGIANTIASKIFLNLLQKILSIPSIVLSSACILSATNLYVNIALYLMAIINALTRQALQFDCSFSNQSKDALVRIVRPLTPTVFTLVLISALPVLQLIFPSTTFLIYVIVALLLSVWQWTYYLRRFVYFKQFFMNMKGITLTIAISTYTCYLSVYLLDNDILNENILMFIATFSFFLGNFFVVFRNSIVKDTIINKDLKGQNQVSLYCLFYWHCYKDITQKKNQLYISSLLKKHINQCMDQACCCKYRQSLYDHSAKVYGDPNMLPHADKVFIRHFLRRLMQEGHQKYPKSTFLVFLLGVYNVEIVEMVTQTMELLRKLSKLQQKKQLSFTEQYLLYCLRKRTSNQILEINFRRGNQDLQSVRKFDQMLIELNEKMRTNVKLYYSLWKQLKQTSFNQGSMFDVCKRSLKLMFSIEQNYKQLRQINTESNQLKATMLFYSKMVIHDIHLLSQVKKDVRQSRQRMAALTYSQKVRVMLFNPKSALMLVSEVSKIKWTSKNAPQIFQYQKQQFHGLTIHQIMPQYFAQRHDDYINKWKQTGHHVKLNKTTTTWATTQDGHVFSALLFVKLIPLLHQHQYAFFGCLQKLDSRNEIVCSQFGQVYGVGRDFSEALKINVRIIQETTPNIQVFFPLCFESFLQYFYPQNRKLKSTRRLQNRLSAFFPTDLQKIMDDLCKQRYIFLRKIGQNPPSFHVEYLGWVRQKMQELSCHINGEYMSFVMTATKMRGVQPKRSDIVVLKVSNFRKQSLQRYYSQLQRMIVRLQLLQEQDMNKKKRSFYKKEKTDFFRAFLNPKRVKYILEEEQRSTKSLNNEVIDQIREKSTLVPVQSGRIARKSVQQQMEHRKRLARGAQIEIKNQRVRYNLWKIKNVLRQEGVISRYTYNILIGKGQTGDHFQPIGESTHNIKQDTTKNVMYETPQDQQQKMIGSQDERESVDDRSEGQLNANKENDNQTFNSASSSATFISMTNHIKQFKVKLRSLNTPLPLLVLNLILLLVVTTILGGLAFVDVHNYRNIDVSMLNFKDQMRTSIALDQLMLAHFNILNINHQTNKTLFLVQKNTLLNNASAILSRQMQQRPQKQLKDSYLLNYLTRFLSGSQGLTLSEFIQRVQGQIITDTFKLQSQSIAQSSEVLLSAIRQSPYLPQISNNIFILFIACLSAGVGLFLGTLPIVNVICSKIQQIYELLGKVSQKERSKYFDHFSSLFQRIRSLQYLQLKELTDILTRYQNKNQNRTRAIKNTISQVGLGEHSQAQLKRQMEQKRDSKKVQAQKQPKKRQPVKRVYWKIIVTYLVLLTSILFNYLYIAYHHTHFDRVNQLFTRIFVQKQQMTLRMISANYKLMGYANISQHQHKQVAIVDAIHSTYQLPEVTSPYKQFVKTMAVGEVCNLLNITTAELEICSKLNRFTFKQGGFDNFYYTQRNLQRLVREHQQAQNGSNTGQNVTFPAYFMTDQFIQLNMGYYFSSLLVYRICDLAWAQMQGYARTFYDRLWVGIVVSISLIVVFVAGWLWLYFSLAQSASYVNAFLLLIPFDVLSQNPYIKLYIRKQFDYKAAAY